jgi:sialidase-1
MHAKIPFFCRLTAARNFGVVLLFACALLCLPLSAAAQTESEAALTAAGHPAEGTLGSFMGESFFDMQIVFEGGDSVREPYLGIALDGTLLALRNKEQHLRRSEDGGAHWGDIIEVPFGFLDTNMIVDENTGDVLVVRMWDGRDRLWRSKDHGKSWQEEPITLKPNEVMKWLDRTGLKTRGTNQGSDTDSGLYYLHANASESGITLRHGPQKGRLLAPATFRPHAKAHPSDRAPIDVIYNCAIYSDDGGATWQVSGLFPDGYTEESAVAELSDGRIYYNSRSCKGFYDKALARDLVEDERLRRTAWSYDGGETWEDLEVNRVLPDGGGYDRGYGMKAGLARLPVEGRDILIYSNSDTAGGVREKMTVWASFDGAKTWPVKRLVYAGPGAYSSMVAGRPGTPSEGRIYLLFEGVEEHAYKGMQVARFNLSWILDGELTGYGEVPDWVTR